MFIWMWVEKETKKKIEAYTIISNEDTRTK